jgi:hypothetical protein
MKLMILACGASLLLGTGVAAAQSYPDAPPPPAPPATPAPPPPGTLSSTRKEVAVDAYGNRYEKTQSTYRNSNGVAQDTTTTRTTVPAPPPPPVTTSTTTSTTSTTAPQ